MLKIVAITVTFVVKNFPRCTLLMLLLLGTNDNDDTCTLEFKKKSSLNLQNVVKENKIINGNDHFEPVLNSDIFT